MNAIIAILLLVSVALATPAEEFAAANVAAVSAAGTRDFEAAIAVADRLCTRKLERASDCDATVVATRQVDRDQRAYDSRKAAASRPAPTNVVHAAPPVASAPVAVARAEVAPPVRPVVYVDQETGLDYVASLAPPLAPWTGMRVTNLQVAVRGAQKVCVMKDGAPLPIGGDVPFSLSHEKGSDVFSCPAGNAMGGVVYAPAGATLYLAKFDIGRQVYVAEKAYTCDPPSNATGRVARKTVTACVPLHVR